MRHNSTACERFNDENLIFDSIFNKKSHIDISSLFNPLFSGPNIIPTLFFFSSNSLQRLSKLICFFFIDLVLFVVAMKILSFFIA